MDCCIRHGISPFHVEIADSFTACMQHCGRLAACRSVDYHEASGKCYFGGATGEPLLDAPGFASAHSLGCAGACKVKGCPCIAVGKDGAAKVVMQTA